MMDVVIGSVGGGMSMGSIGGAKMGFVSPIHEEARREEARLKTVAAGLSEAEKHRLLAKLVETYRQNLENWHLAMSGKKCTCRITVTYENGTTDRR
jgi:hypothetical protein